MDRPSPEHPLAHSFARAQALSPYLKVALGAPQGEGWRAAGSIFAAHERHFDALKQATQQRLRTRTANIVAGALLQSYQWQPIVSAVACYLLDRRVPDLSAATIQLHYNQDGQADAIAYGSRRFVALRDDPAAVHADALPVADLPALRDALRAGIEAHLGGTIEQLCARLGSKPRGLWLNVADGLAGTLVWLLGQNSATSAAAYIRAEVHALLRVPGSPLNTAQLGLVEISFHEHKQVFLDRASCCYWYKTAGGEYCSTCPHRQPEERNALLLKYVAEQHSAQAGA